MKQTPEPPAIEVPTNEVAAVAKWASKDSDRPNLSMVRFADQEYVACDGHRMVRVPCVTFGLKFGVDADALLAAVAAQRAMSTTGVLYLTPTPIAQPDNGWTREIRITLSPDIYLVVPGRDTSKYPPLDRVMPKGKQGDVPPHYSINPSYLAAVAEVIAGHPADDHGGRSAGVDITGWGGELTPMMMTSARGARFIVMPMKGPISKK